MCALCRFVAMENRLNARSYGTAHGAMHSTAAGTYFSPHTLVFLVV
jgi:hypothetical protein